MLSSKERLRRSMLTRLRSQPEAARRAKSKKIERRLRKLSLYRRARRVLCYAAFDGEVETRAILEKALSDGKRVFVPVVTDPVRRRMAAAQVKDLDQDLAHRGHYGIPHPLRLSSQKISPSELDLILLPGIAFDRRGRRLGRGGGYFDRFLAGVPTRVPRIGLAFGFQVLKEIPGESHDQPVRAVVTEKRIYENPCCR